MCPDIARASILTAWPLSSFVKQEGKTPYKPRSIGQA